MRLHTDRKHLDHQMLGPVQHVMEKVWESPTVTNADKRSQIKPTKCYNPVLLSQIVKKNNEFIQNI